MRVFGDRVTVGQTAEVRRYTACLGPLTVADVSVGWSATVQGKFFGRIKLPISVPGYLWIEVKVLGRLALYGSFQLS